MEYLFLALLAATALFWATVLLLRGGLAGTSMLMLLAASCFGYDFFHASIGLPISIDRIMFLVLIGQYIVYRQWGWTDPKPLTKADYVLIALLAVVAGSAFTHDYMAEKAKPISHLVLFYLMPAVMYWIARQTRWSERSAWILFGSLAAFGIYLAVTAVAETRDMWYLVYPKYIASPEFPDYFGRGRGPFLSPMANGFVQALALCAALIIWPRLPRPTQLVALAVSPIYLLGIYSTLTRSVWMGAGAGLLIVFGLSLPKRWRTSFTVAATVVCVAIPVIGWDNLMVFKREKGVDAEVSADSAKLRPILGGRAWRMFQDHPLVGCGYGQYSREMPAYLHDRSIELPLETARPYVQHNAFLGMLTETGLIGMTLFVVLLFYWGISAWRLWGNPHAPLWMQNMGLLFLATLGVYLPNAMFHDMSLIPMVNLTLFFLAGATTGLSLEAAHVPRYGKLESNSWNPTVVMPKAAR